MSIFHYILIIFNYYFFVYITNIALEKQRYITQNI